MLYIRCLSVFMKSECTFLKNDNWDTRNISWRCTIVWIIKNFERQTNHSESGFSVILQYFNDFLMLLKFSVALLLAPVKLIFRFYLITLLTASMASVDWKVRICSYLLKKSYMKNFIFVQYIITTFYTWFCIQLGNFFHSCWTHSCWPAIYLFY